MAPRAQRQPGHSATGSHRRGPRRTCAVVVDCQRESRIAAAMTTAAATAAGVNASTSTTARPSGPPGCMILSKRRDQPPLWRVRFAIVVPPSTSQGEIRFGTGGASRDSERSLLLSCAGAACVAAATAATRAKGVSGSNALALRSEHSDVDFRRLWRLSRNRPTHRARPQVGKIKSLTLINVSS